MTTSLEESTMETNELMERQLKVELAANDYSRARLDEIIRKRTSTGHADELLEGRMILLHSIDALSEKITEYFEAPLKGLSGSHRNVLAEEFHEDPKALAYVVLVTVVRYISQEDMVSVAQISRALGRNIHDSIMVRRLDKQFPKLYSYVEKVFRKHSAEAKHREKLKIAARQEELADQYLNPMTAMLGGTLVDLVMKSGINIIEVKNVRRDGKTTHFIKYTDECYRMVLQSRGLLLEEYRKYPIFLVQPKDWERFEGSGGYYHDTIYKMNMIKAKPETRKILSGYFGKNDVSNLADILNTLQATAWRVNKRVLEVMDYVFQNNIYDPNYPRHNPRLIGDLPVNTFMEPEDYINIHNYAPLHKDGPYKGKPSEKPMIRKFHKDVETQRTICMSNNGKAMMHNMIMANAKEYMDEDRIYFSYQYDSRGRIYPIQQHLQPQSSTKVKALLEFADGSPIGDEEQEWWFMIHGANTYKYDKLPYKDRVSKMRELHSEIVAAADDPLGNRDFWGEADAPYMFLAWCFEYRDYHRDPKNFLSHIPISLDATCSGIQIYSGLLRDAEGAASVNVIGENREDVYQQVADKVNGYLETGDYDNEFSYTDKAGEFHVYDTRALAASLRGNVTRSLVKRNVMTQPYSVTKRGMFDQLTDELTELEHNNKRFWVGDIWVVAKFLSDLNERAITEVVKGAKVGQEYLKDVTKDLMKSGKYVAYKAPLTKFPVVQKLGKRKRHQVKTPIGHIIIYKTLPELDKLRMVNGIAPNFVHSLDAALLATTVMRLKEAGCSNFHMIHDSYGVPINQIGNLNRLVRQTFIDLFDEDPLGKFVEAVNPNYEVRPEDVMIGTLDLEDIRLSSYIFS